MGREFWLALSRTSPALIDTEVSDIYGCPVRDGWRAGTTDYLGPPVFWGSLEDRDPIGCDEAGNHNSFGDRGGNVIFKSGDVREITEHGWQDLHRSGRVVP